MVTRVPGAVKFLNGVINLRGAVVPVADIRIKFGMSATAQMEDSCIKVVEVDATAAEGEIVVGVLADQVLEVANVSQSDMHMHPEMGTGIPPQYLRGLGKLGDKFFMVLDVDAIISEDVEELSTGSLSAPAGHEP